MSFNIVLIEPEIPMNTGNIGRLALASGSTLHLVQPLGFEITDKRLKRAGLDYWQHIEVYQYEHSEAFFEQHRDQNMAFFSSHAEKSCWDLEYEASMFLIFGKESIGLPKAIHDRYPNDFYKIPMVTDTVRSLNLANAASVVVYEGMRQLLQGN